MAQPRAALRQLLRAIDATLPRENGSNVWRDYVLTEFRKEMNADSAAKGVKLMKDTTTLINAIKHQRELLFSYNISTSKADSGKKLVSNTAARVGLRVPIVYEDPPQK
mmetsp:Transcript_7166/g.14541  ORF Transcript_7166/g.14541 Transcript_7166/m.14541 type:complete len:108 (-) Transcript_7166:293-616(-)|eukprot:CAMPEP_0118925686 /NCGR_PEP_ID=MMETSP1169-20130426/3534_1 /TAXON_ID=36882 /ORGANISM="Pyramimonas obovata, Strain CCMP722" /LENGTH=107 /DNA_ID=CAMNT_0006867057 /DNA_START=324 /DNA_END=647 /DNA_ORIENTATION=-